MSKTERQINLVFLLLNSKRGLTRSQIKDSILDYRNSVSSSAFERMFERDKEELRGIGFLLESNQDLLSSSDEIYYKIKKEDSFLDVNNLLFTDRLLLQIARSYLLINSATPLKTLIKLDTVPMSDKVHLDINDNPEFSDSIFILLDAISSKKRISFRYQSGISFEIENREVTPLRLIFRDMNHYLIGYDLKRSDFRAYRLDRILSSIQIGIVDEFNYSLEKIDHFNSFMTERKRQVSCKVTVKSDYILEESSSPITIIRDNQTTYTLFCSAPDLEYLFRYLLRNLDMIVSIEPSSTSEAFKEYLKQAQNVRF